MHNTEPSQLLNSFGITKKNTVKYLNTINVTQYNKMHLTYNSVCQHTRRPVAGHKD